jgi:DNA-binding MarR family transcriptional regulator
MIAQLILTNDIRLLSRKIEALIAREATKIGISLHGYLILDIIGSGSVRKADIASHDTMVKSSVTYQLETLKAAGYVSYHADERDKRVVRVKLTDKGADALHQIDVFVKRIESTLRSDAHLAALSTLIMRANTTLDEELRPRKVRRVFQTGSHAPDTTVSV